jgi:hypothetical protein
MRKKTTIIERNSENEMKHLMEMKAVMVKVMKIVMMLVLIEDNQVFIMANVSLRNEERSIKMR